MSKQLCFDLMAGVLLAWLSACSAERDLATFEERDEPSAQSALAVSGTVCEVGLTSAGSSPLCSSCACGRCDAQADACSADTKCAAAAACMHASGCSGAACYCGTDLFGCLFGAKGPCKGEYEAAAGKSGEAAIKAALANAQSSLGKAAALQTCTRGAGNCKVACSPDAEPCSFHDEACWQRYCAADPALEAARASSAQKVAAPSITRVSVNGVVAWTPGGVAPTLRPGDKVTLEGSGFGAGTDVDFSKLLIGNVRVLETDLTMYEQKIDVTRQVNYEVNAVRGTWAKDILGWTDTQIVFNVPRHVVRGPIVVQVQKRTGANGSYTQAGQPHAVVDAQQLRVTDAGFEFRCDVVSQLSAVPVASKPVAVNVVNPARDALVKRGREIYWSYDFNIGLAHSIRGLDWSAIFAGKTKDPMTGLAADPELLFGAYETVSGQVPDEAIEDVYFDPYPMKNPIPGFLTVTAQKAKGTTRNSGYVGYRYAESTNPYTGDGKWIGFNCASCHSYRIQYQDASGGTVIKVFPGLPNPRWSMRWSLLGNFKGIVGDEPGPRWKPGQATIDKTAMVYAMPAGGGEHNIIRMNGEGSHTDNDYGFSPIAIPNVSYYLPIRRSLGHTESYVGFEGSYIHSEEPDGAMGSMDAESLKALTAYMSELDRDDDLLRKLGVYRWLKAKSPALVAGITEGTFVKNGAAAYAPIKARLDHGAQIFAQRCASCHQDGTGTFTNERMIPLGETGKFFEPTIYQREQQSIRVTFLRDLFFTQHRGLLTDGHVRSLDDLVNPDRCTEGTALYDRYYTLHAPEPGKLGEVPGLVPALPSENPRGDVFRIVKSPTTTTQGKQRNAFVERFRYFVSVPWDADHYYWDYQKFRKEYGPWELGSAEPLGMPAAPHPWCAGSKDEVADLALYLASL